MFYLYLNGLGAITDGLVRVDVMQTKDGRLVVNEFEGFEALYEGTGSADSKDYRAKNFLINYYEKKLGEILWSF